MFDLSLQVLKGDTCHNHSLAIIILQHWLSILSQLFCSNPTLTICDTFQTSNLQALALLQDFNKGGCFRKRIMGSGIEPSKSSCHGLYLQLLILQELLVYGGDFQLTTSGWHDMLSYIYHLVWIEIQAYHCIVALRIFRLLFNAQAIALLIKLSNSISFWITYTIAKNLSYKCPKVSLT